MKFTSITLAAFTVSSVVASGGRKDHGTPTTTTVLAPTEASTHRFGHFDHTSRTKASSPTGDMSTHVYGRFDKTKRPSTVTSFVPQSVIDHSKSISRVSARSSSFYHGDVVYVGKAVNDTGAGAVNGTGAGASNGTAGGAGSNSTGGVGSSANIANGNAAGYGLGLGAALVGAALLI
ncbi:unnamed protein product [Candida verbasci]|uniref:Uncharacterized protein n=1 Tax=Candida verbasci TaxID=1227364 RepID=A0A9W4XC24_9ASCO|nr:unnamed protein product [Candida verbasci]